MKRTQLNVSIDPTLLEKIKKSAKISGKSLVAYVTDCFVNQIENLPVESIDSRFQTIEKRIKAIEKNLKLQNPQSQQIPSFTSTEEKNFNEFIKAVFRKELTRKGYSSIKEAWNDFINHINCFEQWDETCSFRLKESLFIEHGDPLTSAEINHLAEGEICPQPIRTGIINWINNSDRGKCCCSVKDFPSQQQICEKGSMLLKDIYS
tara:strand:- start:3221 stop:3838 length:618 start_codon:yes stop_codon:yes gene_type:complete